MALPLLGAVASGLFGLFGASSKKRAQAKADAENRARQEAADAENRRRQLEADEKNAQALVKARQDDYARRDYEIGLFMPSNIRKEAENAGLNPLLFTNSAFQPSSYAGGGAVMSSPAPVSAVFKEASTFGSDVANAFGGAVNTYTSLKSMELQETQMKLNNQLATDRARAMALRPQIGGIFSRRSGSSAAAKSASDIADEANAYNSSDASDDLSKDRRTNTEWFGVQILPNPWFSDGQVFETRYGDQAINPIGMANYVLDPLYTGGKAWYDFAKKALANGPLPDPTAWRPRASVPSGAVIANKKFRPSSTPRYGN